MENEIEELINAWIRLSVSLRNDKITKNLTFNEAIVCNFIFNYEKLHNKPMQIKELCEKASMTKPLMNRVLNDLEIKGMVIREKNTKDMRNVYVRLKSDQVVRYKSEHLNSMRVAKNVADLIGEDIHKVISIFNKVADAIDELL